jgi:transcription initiation factor TFIIIB Brf1 subunit/transcription initiation factor TFIIB
LECPNCKNEVFVNLENGSSQCTRCGWIAKVNNLPTSKNEQKRESKRRPHFF